jgi:hypothetical protein
VRILSADKRCLFFLQGGLGNQLHILSAAISYAKATSAHVTVSDIFLGAAKTPRSNSIRTLFPDLRSFGVEVNYARELKWIGRYPRIIILKLLLMLGRANRFRIYNFGNSGVSLEDLISLDILIAFGYFQSFDFPNFLQRNIPSLFASPFDSINVSKICDEIDENLILIHIRGGDYLEKTNADLGVLSSEYFEVAVRKLMNYTEKSRIWVITNDRKHAEKVLASTSFEVNLILDESSKLTEIEILKLMSCASRIVISNSTFSWWGGYLASCRESVHIVAPKPWFRNLQDNRSTRIPTGWNFADSIWEQNE